MIKEGALDNPRTEVIFGLHVTAPGRTGTCTTARAPPWPAPTPSASR